MLFPVDAGLALGKANQAALPAIRKSTPRDNIELAIP